MRHSDPFEIEYFKLPPARDCFIAPREKLENTPPPASYYRVAHSTQWAGWHATRSLEGPRVISVMAGFNPVSMPELVSLVRPGRPNLYAISGSRLMNHNPTPALPTPGSQCPARYTSGPFTRAGSPLSRLSVRLYINNALWPRHTHFLREQSALWLGFKSSEVWNMEVLI